MDKQHRSAHYAVLPAPSGSLSPNPFRRWSEALEPVWQSVAPTFGPFGLDVVLKRPDRTISTKSGSRVLELKYGLALNRASTSGRGLNGGGDPCRTFLLRLLCGLTDGKVRLLALLRAALRNLRNGDEPRRRREFVRRIRERVLPLFRKCLAEAEEESVDMWSG